MTQRMRVFVKAFVFALGMSAIFCKAGALCNANERVVFSCTAGKKVASLCASGKLQRDDGRLIYRFGRDMAHIELEHGGLAKPAQSTFTFDYNAWAKGQSTTVGFSRGAFKYFVRHAAGVYGVDGGPNIASVRVMRDKEDIADIACNEPTTIDHMYEELQKLGLPSANAL